jgi:hypothetical protein
MEIDLQLEFLLFLERKRSKKNFKLFISFFFSRKTGAALEFVGRNPNGVRPSALTTKNRP